MSILTRKSRYTSFTDMGILPPPSPKMERGGGAMSMSTVKGEYITFSGLDIVPGGFSLQSISPVKKNQTHLSPFWKNIMFPHFVKKKKRISFTQSLAEALAQQLWRRKFLNVANAFSLFCYYLYLEKGMSLYLNTFKYPLPECLV